MSPRGKIDLLIMSHSLQTSLDEYVGLAIRDDRVPSITSNIRLPEARSLVEMPIAVSIHCDYPVHVGHWERRMNGSERAPQNCEDESGAHYFNLLSLCG